MSQLLNTAPDGYPRRGLPWWALILGACALLGSFACVTTGNKAIVDKQVVSQIEVNKSTRVQVFKLLGLPEQVSYPEPGGEVWNYFCVTAAPKPMDYMILTQPVVGGYDINSQRLTLIFNKDGVVQNLEFGKMTGPEGTMPY